MPDYKTTDYCARCGESPESGTHMLPGHGHEYVPPCRCPPNYHGVLHHVACFQQGPRAAPTAMPPQALVGAARVKVEDRPGMPQFGVFVGLLLDEHGDTQAVVRLDHYGLMLKALHPSKVVPVTPEEEEAFKS
jgi:hypothetical protein